MAANPLVVDAVQLVRLPYHINEPVFAEALVHNFLEIAGDTARRGAA